jgi:hypothetical protein
LSEKNSIESTLLGGGEMTLEGEISARVGEVRTDTFDMSFGEISSLHGNKELIIQPEYQRLFRWTIAVQDN